jgi:hypothetical protein
MVHPERIKNTAVLTAVKLGLEAFTPPGRLWRADRS